MVLSFNIFIIHIFEICFLCVKECHLSNAILHIILLISGTKLNNYHHYSHHIDFSEQCLTCYAKGLNHCHYLDGNYC